VNNGIELDFEKTTEYTLGVQVDGIDSDVQIADITINVEDVTEVANFTIDPIANSITSANVVFVGVAPILNGEDPIGNITYTLSGVDSNHFTIDPITGVTTMVTHNFDNPEDANNDNVYEIIIIATDDDNNTTSANQKVQVTIDSVVIGTQIWSAQNIKLTPDESYILDEDYANSYLGSSGSVADDDGYYYTWNAAQNVCPSSWRLPSDDDWKTLEKYLGMNYDEADDFGWRGEGKGENLKVGGSTGFNAKMAGFSDGADFFGHNSDDFFGRGGITYFWTSTVSDADTDTDENNAYRRSMSTIETKIYRDILLKTFMLSVRCVK
jgi:uncharacterized protein (TIGR02145 family)